MYLRKALFSKQVVEKLGCYVYRLIDPRNGETFYVRKGRGNRVFAHAQGELSADPDALNEKLLRIHEIRVDGFEVGHLIHRHGMSEDEALEVEAALIDAFPEVSNQVGGQGSGERGLMHANQVIEHYEAEEAVFRHKVLLININQSATKRGVKAAVSYAWKVDPKRAEKAEFVLAVAQGLIVGVFIAEKPWLKATSKNFPGTTTDWADRWGFIPHEAPEQIAKMYLRCRVPKPKRGAANPIRYLM